LTSPLEIAVVGPAEMLAPCSPLAPTLKFFIGLGFRVETIFPAEEPHTASLSGHGLRLRLAPVGGDPGVIRLASKHVGTVLTAPNGTRVELIDPDPPIDVPDLRPEFVITRHDDGPLEGVGRAGMIYRDLIPSRLGGRYIASHIVLPEGGPVADWVHFHKIRFQLIFCRRGWARLVYEDQGPPFIMAAGDCVLQPPRIRHRVLESSPGFEVVEIGCPALHETLADHAMDLPTRPLRPDRDFSGQVFLHHVAADAPWTPYGATGFQRRDTGVAKAAKGIADAYVLRPDVSDGFAPTHNCAEFLFGFMLEGSAVLERRGSHPLGPVDAFVIPESDAWGLSGCSPDASILLVTAPAQHTSKAEVGQDAA
jgi:quercetin dioxygenase-like cupin family protein